MRMAPEIRAAILERLAPDYAAQLARLPLTRKSRGDLEAGFRDGVRACAECFKCGGFMPETRR